ncbi:MAG: carboxylating nicotinate-nucleotide diphosphorylase [Candidatus Thorarchaeota archaeon]|nr:carboxylating nicotinate-nucleotide diphosphorylase [Candidatus Thorarchaeota archaeon]
MKQLPSEVIEDLKRFLKEDIRSGDLTSDITIPANAKGKATIYAKSKAVLAGMEEVIAIAELTGLQHDLHVFEGNWVSPGEGVLTLTGPARTLLAVERVSLNIVQRMSGIATKTYKMVHEARRVNSKVKVAATRKTTPGFRYFEKRAVTIGGGDTHRYALDDMVLIKNNHISVVGSVGEAVKLARREASFSKKISCEVRTLQECLEAIKAGADIVLLDNFSPQDVAGVHKILTEKGLRGKIILEVSGGIDQDNIRAYAESGCDVLSSGSLTHSYDSSDFNMLLTIK